MTRTRRLGLRIALAGAILTAAALAALLWPRSALSLIADAENAAACTVLRDELTHQSTQTLAGTRLDALRTALAQTRLQWTGRAGEWIEWEDGQPFYSLFFPESPAFRLTGSRVYCQGGAYRLSREDAQKLSELLEAAFS